MVKWAELNDEDKHDVFTEAWTWRHDHADHVARLLNDASRPIAPEGSDLFKPELWKGIHWLWFQTLKSEIEK
jgi:hypothetical protein